MTASESSHQIHWELGNLLKVSTIDGSLDQTWGDIGVSLADSYVGSWGIYLPGVPCPNHIL